MNVQLRQNPRAQRLQNPEVQQCQAPLYVCPLESRPQCSQPLVLSAETEHKWLTVAFFTFVIGLIILNSGWSTQHLGYPLMLAGVLFPLFPAWLRWRATREQERTRTAFAVAVGKGNVRGGRVYELQSKDYSLAATARL